MSRWHEKVDGFVILAVTFSAAMTVSSIAKSCNGIHDTPLHAFTFGFGQDHRHLPDGGCEGPGCGK